MQPHYHQNYPNIDCPAYHHNKQLNTMKILTHKSFLKMLTKPFGTLFLMFLLAFNANAQTIFNNGGGNNLWSNPANWDSGVPNGTTNATIPVGFTCILDVAGAACKDLTIGDDLAPGVASLQINANGITLDATSVAVNDQAVINVTGAFDFKLRVTNGVMSLNDGSCFVPGFSTLTLGSGAVTPTGGTITLAIPSTLNLYNFEIDYGNTPTVKPFTHSADVGLNITNNLLLTSGSLNSGTNLFSTLVVGKDLIVPVPGGTIARALKQNEAIFDFAATACTNTTTPNASASNLGSTLEVQDVKIASGATLGFTNTSYLRVRRHWGDTNAPTVSTGGISMGLGQTPTIEFMGTADGQTFGAVNGNHVNFSTAFVVINKQPTGPIPGKFIAKQGIICAGRFAIKRGEFSIPSGSNPQFTDVCISGGDFQHITSQPAISGNWTIVEKGTYFNGDPIGSTNINETISFTGTGKSIIKITPDGTTSANIAANQPFRSLVINKTTATGIVENSVGAGNGTVIRVLKQLRVENGLLFIREVTADVPTNFPQLSNQVPGFTVTHADGTMTDVPPADLEVRDGLIVNDGAGLNFTNVLSAGLPVATNTPSTSLTLWVTGELSDKNSNEPTARTGFYVGNPSVLGRFSDRPVVVFTGNKSTDVAGNYLLRNALDQNVGTPKGIILPNVIIARQGATNAGPIFDVSIGVVVGTGGMRVLGDMVICAGYRFTTASRDFYFGDESNNDALLTNTDILDVFGRFLVSAGSTFYIATGGDARGAFLRVRDGGQITFGGTPALRVTVARDIQAGTYYRMCAYSGSKVNASYTDFAFQGASNDGFFPTLPAAQTARQFNYGTGTAQNALNNGVAGVNRNFLNDFVNSNSGALANTQSKGGFKILKGASIGNADVIIAGTPDAPVPIPTGGNTKRDFSSCSFQAGATCFTALTINTGQALDISEVTFVGSSGSTSAGCDYNIVNFFDDYKDNAFNTDGVNELNIIYCYGCLGARGGSLGEVYDGGYIAGSPAATPTTTGRGGGEERVIFLANQLIWWTGGAGTNSWNNLANWTVDKTVIATQPNVPPGANGAVKTEVNRAAYIAFIRAKVIAGEVFQADEVTPYPLAPLYDVGQPVIGAFVKPQVILIGGVPTTIFVIRYKRTGETNRDYEVFIPNDGNVATPLVDIDNPTVGFPDVWITGSLLINGARGTTPGLNGTMGGVGAMVDKTVDIDNKILRVENDAIGIGGSANTGIRYTGTPAAVGTSGVFELGGNLAFYFGGQYIRSNDFSLLRLITNSIQQVRLEGARDISNLVINKVLFNSSNVQIVGSEGGGVIFQGNATAMPVKFDATITTGDLTMFSETPFIVERNFTMEVGGSLNLISAYAVFGGNFTNKGLVGEDVNGGRRIFFTPINTTLGAATRTITTGGAALPPVTFLNGSIPWGSLATTFGIGGNNVYAPGAGASNSVVATTLVQYNLLDNFITSGAGGNVGALEEGTVIQNNRRVNSSNNTTLRFFSPTASAGINILRIATGGILNLTPGVKLEIDAATANSRTFFVENGGLLVAVGASNTSSFITRYGSTGFPDARFAFTVQGFIRARFYTFEFMDADGVNLATANTSRALDFDANGNGTPSLFNTVAVGDVVGVSRDERCFSNCTFTNGTNPTLLLPTPTLLKVHNTAFPNYGAGINVALASYPASTLYIENANFPSPLAGASSNVAWVNVQAKGTFNAAPAATDNKLIFNLAIGGYAGEDFDADFTTSTDLANVGNCIRWVEPAIIAWTGAAATLGVVTAANEAIRATSTDWHNALNWFPATVPTATDNVVLDRRNFEGGVANNLDYKVIITNSINVKSIKISQAGITPGGINNRRIILQVGTAVNAPIVQAEEALTIIRNKGVNPSTSINDAILIIANASAQLNVGKSWSNEGRFLNGNVNDPDGTAVAAANIIVGVGTIQSSTLVGFPTTYLNGGAIVNFNRDFGRAIYNGSASSTDVIFTKFNAFHNVTFIGPRTDLNSNMYVQSNLSINNSSVNGLLSANNGNFTIDIKGNWTNNGIFEPTAGTIRFTGTTNQTVVRNFFYPFTVNGSATVRQPENFNDVEIKKTIGTSVILNSRVFISGINGTGEITFTTGNVVASTNRELIIDGGGSAGAANPNSYVIGPVARIFNTNAAAIFRTYPIGDVGAPGVAGYVANVGFRVTLTRSISTAISITQLVGPPTTTPNARVLPPQFNAIGQRCYWNVKNINFPINELSPGIADTADKYRADFDYGNIELVFNPLEQTLPPPLAPATVANYGGATDNGAAATVEVSIVQTPAVDFGGGTSVSRTFSLGDKRGFGPVLNGSTWIDLGGTSDFSGGTPSFTSDLFSYLGNGDFALAYKFIPLPVELIDFNGKYVDDRVRLNWVVTSEKDVASYTVSRSPNGRADSFVEIGTVAANTSPTTINTYGLDDFNSISGINYYRLAQTDKDGTRRNISKIIAVTNRKNLGDGQMLLYPNPSDNGKFSINIPERNEMTTISVYGLTGAKVFEQEIQSTDNGKIENIDASKYLSKGLYVVRVKVADKVYQTKLSIN